METGPFKPIPVDLMSLSKEELVSIIQTLGGSVKELKSVVIQMNAQLKTANARLEAQTMAPSKRPSETQRRIRKRVRLKLNEGSVEMSV